MPRFLFFLLFSLSAFTLHAAATQADFNEEDEENSTANQQIERQSPQPMQAWLANLKQEVAPEEILELTLGETTAFALYLRAYAPEPKGQVILLPGANEHPNWPKGIASLRLGLAEQGWTSLALALPFYTGWQNPPRQLGTEPLLTPNALNKKPKKIKPQEVTEEASALAASEEVDEAENLLAEEDTSPATNLAAFELLQMASEARLNAALEFLPAAKKQVLVLQGESLYWLAAWLKNNPVTAKQPLILLFNKPPAGATAKAVNELLESLTDQPILDIYLATSLEQSQQAKQRKIAYQRAGNKQAVQLEAKPSLNQLDGTDKDWLVKRVEGWLRRIENNKP